MPTAPSPLRAALARRVRCALPLVALLLPACAPTAFLVTPVPAERKLEEHVLYRESAFADRKIAVLDVNGVLRNSRDRSLLGVEGENPVSLFVEKLEKAGNDGRVRAVVLRINSPGGTVTASSIMYTELLNFRRRTGKPVVACMLDLATSGGYYLACAADKIYAHESSITGSIGVIMILPEFTGTMQKLGVTANVFKSGELKDAGSPFRQMNTKDREVFDGLIAKMYQGFFDVVLRSRGLKEEKLRELADGRVFLAADAKEQGLIDEVGTIGDAILAAKKLAGAEGLSVTVVEYSRPQDHRPNAYAQGGAPSPQLNLVNINVPDMLVGPAPEFLYLWAPGW